MASVDFSDYFWVSQAELFYIASKKNLTGELFSTKCSHQFWPAK